MAQQKRSPLTIYFILACAISWAFMIPAITLAAKDGYALPTAAEIGDLAQTGFKDGRHIWLSLLGTLSSYGPLAAAFILVALEGRSSLPTWWQRVSHWRAGRQSYRDLLVLFAVIFLPLFVASLVLGPDPEASTAAIPLVVFLPYLLYELLTSGLEEPGWRGFALPRLQERYSPKKSSLILGLVWGIWHWPAFIPVYLNQLNAGSTAMAALSTATVQVLIYTFFNILAATFIHTWLYNRTKSAFLNILLHGGSNAIGGYILAATPNAALGMVYGVVRWVVAIMLIQRYWKPAREPENLGAIQINP